MDETITKSGVSTWVYDPTRNLIYIADDNTGTVSTWSIAANQIVGAMLIGHPVDTLAITADGGFLIAGETNAVSMGDAGGVDAVDRINLISQQVDRLTFNTVFREGGVAHLAIGANNQVLISDWAATTAGDYPLHSFDAEAPSPTFSTPPGLPAVQTGSFLFSSPDHGLVLITEANSSGVPLDLYEARQDQLLAQLPALASVVPADFNRGVGDVTSVATPGVPFVSSSGMVAVSPGEGTVYVLDTQLHLVRNLTPLFPPDPNSHIGESIISVKFTDDARELFVWDQTTNKISVIDTQTWQRVATLDAPTGHGSNPPDFQQWGLMDFVNHDQELLVDDQDALHVIDLSATLHINLSGTAGNDILNGGVGTDSLSGGAGDDTITGGDGGADTLEGGSGNDLLVSGRGAVVMEGGDGADTLNAVYNNAVVSGGAGDDLIELTGMFTTDPLHLTRLDGGDGDDRFIVYAFPNQALTIDGGTGHNALEMHYFGTELTPIALHLNGDGAPGTWQGLGLQTVAVIHHLANIVGGDASETITAPGVIDGGGGDDVLTGSDPLPADPTQLLMAIDGADTINGGTGNDTIHGLAGTSYLRGDDGDDSIVGGAQFDDINGNKGDDTIDGGSGGGDWLVGGQANDLITAHASDNLLYGNLGNDTLISGSGHDTMRGGQGDDSLVGGSGDDFVSGDRGNDTMSGGAGADIFHTSQDAGIDKVLDFHQFEGDRVMLDPGTTFTVSQVGADTVIDMGGGNEMILVGVQMSTLTPGWIFGA